MTPVVPSPSAILWILLLFVLVDALKMFVELWNRSRHRTFTSDLSDLTALIATHNGRDVIGETVLDLIRAGLARSQILVIDDGSTDGTSEILRELEISLHRVPHMGKVAAISFGIEQVKTPYVLLLDDDTRIRNARIPTSLLECFDAVSFNVIPDRRDGVRIRGTRLITSLQRYEYFKSMEIGKRFQDGTTSVTCVSGAIGLFRKECLRASQRLHTGVFQGEDLQRTLIELLNGGSVAYVGERVWTVVPDNLLALVRQRLLYWYPGNYHVFLLYVKLLFRRRSPWRLRWEASYSIFVLMTEPLRFCSLLTSACQRPYTELLLIYALYLMIETCAFMTIHRELNIGRKYLVLLMYPLFSLGNVILRALACIVWFHKRFITGEMRPKLEKSQRGASGQKPAPCRRRPWAGSLP